MQQCRSPGLIVFTSVSCDCLCYLRAPCQFSSSPGFHITHIPKANLVYIFWFVLHSSYSYHTYKFIFSFWFSGARNMEMYLVIVCAYGKGWYAKPRRYRSLACWCWVARTCLFLSYFCVLPSRVFFAFFWLSQATA